MTSRTPECQSTRQLTTYQVESPNSQRLKMIRRDLYSGVSQIIVDCHSKIHPSIATLQMQVLCGFMTTKRRSKRRIELWGLGHTPVFRSGVGSITLSSINYWIRQGRSLGWNSLLLETISTFHAILTVLNKTSEMLALTSSSCGTSQATGTTKMVRTSSIFSSQICLKAQ